MRIPNGWNSDQVNEIAGHAELLREDLLPKGFGYVLVAWPKVMGASAAVLSSEGDIIGDGPKSDEARRITAAVLAMTAEQVLINDPSIISNNYI